MATMKCKPLSDELDSEMEWAMMKHMNVLR